MTKDNPIKEEWRNKEPWISIEGVVWDVKGGITPISQAVEQIKEYVQDLLHKQKQDIAGELEKKIKKVCGLTQANGNRISATRIEQILIILMRGEWSDSLLQDSDNQKTR